MLETALKLPQGIYDTLHSMDAGMIRIQKAAKVDIPAYNGLTTPRYAHPVVPAAAANTAGAPADTSASAGIVAPKTSVAFSASPVLPGGKE